MTLPEMKTSSKIWLTAAEVAPVLECDPNYVRWQAQNDPAKLGFPVVVMKTRIRIPRKRFLEYLGEAS